MAKNFNQKNAMQSQFMKQIAQAAGFF